MGGPAARGQIATFMIIFAVVVFLMCLVTVNIGRVALWKTATANAADTAALSVATNLGSQARAMCAQIRNTPNPGLCKSCVFGGYFGIVLGVIIIIVGVVLLFTPLFAGGVALIALGIAMIIQTALFDTHNISKLNSRFNRLPPKTGMKLSVYATALPMIADDPHKVPDTRDIDGDGNTTEQVAAFADWFEGKLKAIEDQVAIANAASTEAFTAKLTQAREDIQGLVDMLENEMIPVFEWIETEYDGRAHVVLGADGVTLEQIFRPKIDLTFWKPGDQGSAMCLANGDPCGVACHDHLAEDSNNDAPGGLPDTGDNEDEDPGVLEIPPGIQPCDQVDFVLSEAKGFVSFADGVLALPPEERALSVGQWVDAFKDFGAASFQDWALDLENWQTELRDTVAPQVVWPPPEAFQLLPPPSPPVPAGENPIDWAIARLAQGQSTLEDWRHQLEKAEFKPIEVPVNPKDMIYSWQDTRGCHHIGAEVYRYTASGDRTDLRIPKFHIIRKFAKTCIYVKRMTGEIQVVVKRFDQNQQVGPWFSMSQHPTPLPPDVDPCVCTPDHLCDQEVQSQVLNAGIQSSGVARYSFKSSHGIRIKYAE